MSIESLLERLVVAAERIADASGGATAAAVTNVAADAAETPRGRGRPRKVATVEAVPAGVPDTGEASEAFRAYYGAPAPTAQPAAVAATSAASVTSVHPVEELQKLVGYVCSQGLAAGVKTVFTKYNVERASAIPADKRDAAFEEIKALLPQEGLAS